MTRYFAFLRAINVGGHNVKMDFLKSIFKGCGFTGVETFIASGNIVFDSPSLDVQNITQTIEHHLRDNLDYPVAAFIRSSGNLSSIINYQPFSENESANIYIAFLGSTPESRVCENLYANNSNENVFRVKGQEVYWLCRTRFSDSVFSGAQLEKILGMQATIRNRTTLLKIVNKYILS